MLIREYWEHRNKYTKEIGIEIEMEGDFLPIEVKGWHVIADGSLRGNGFEYITQGPIDRDEILGTLNNLWFSFKKHESNLTPSDRCGIHVHLNCQNIEIEEVWNVAILYLMLEDLLLKFCGDDRDGNLFCLGTRDAQGILISLIKDKERGIFNLVTDEQSFKYSSINFATLRKYGTLEFRALGTEKTYDKFLIWLELLLAIKDYALKTKSTVDLIHNISVNGVRTFLNEVFGIKNSRMLRNLFSNYEEIAVNNMRRVQTLAFTKTKQSTRRKRNYETLMEIEEEAPEF